MLRKDLQPIELSQTTVIPVKKVGLHCTGATYDASHVFDLKSLSESTCIELFFITWRHINSLHGVSINEVLWLWRPN